MNYKDAAKNFYENEKQFQLGVIPTEQSNPLTRNLSATIAKDTAEGVKTILSADVNIPKVAAKAFKTKVFTLFSHNSAFLTQYKKGTIIGSLQTVDKAVSDHHDQAPFST